MASSSSQPTFFRFTKEALLLSADCQFEKFRGGSLIGPVSIICQPLARWGIVIGRPIRTTKAFGRGAVFHKKGEGCYL